MIRFALTSILLTSVAVEELRLFPTNAFRGIAVWIRLSRIQVIKERGMNSAMKAAVWLAMLVATWAADDPFLGTWKLNVGKSKMSSGAAPESRIETFTA